MIEILSWDDGRLWKLNCTIEAYLLLEEDELNIDIVEHVLNEVCEGPIYE